ncbi:MAG TPA: hypothetical protein PLZ08_03860 [Bacillota bacterium]|jgi:hypothetical protein|nr:hypothetical protein [Bacillota bacterium]HOL09376.1 hypothetical protein [Bacillota bacterium]HPO97075.1 hypothetical protein [Bacillota bacterium]
MADKLSSKDGKYFGERFWKGLIFGLLLGAFGVILIMYVLIRFQGFTIAVNPEMLANIVAEKVRNEIKSDIPQLVEEVKKELPQEIGKHLEDFDSLKISFGNSSVQLPIEISKALKTELNSIIETAVISTLNDYDFSDYEVKIAKDTFNIVDNLLRKDIIGKTYRIRPAKWLEFPVKIVESSKYHFQMGL